jgi:hypothetical protein
MLKKIFVKPQKEFSEAGFTSKRIVPPALKIYGSAGWFFKTWNLSYNENYLAGTIYSALFKIG